jgi:pimeloyl-ACP methyl ester carboxylesterase
VILEAAADMMSADWAWVQPALAKQTRVCAYDRAGMGWSDSGAGPRDAQHVTTELHALLTRAGINPPYILVGHSVGGLYVRLFAAQYPEEVVGLVLIDPGHPEMEARIPALRAEAAVDRRLVGALRLAAYVGITRLMGIGRANARGLPSRPAAEVEAHVSTPQHFATLDALMAATPATYAQVRNIGPVSSMPLVVISANTAWLSTAAGADDARRRMNELHSELARLSTNGQHRIVDNATHGSLVHDREHAQATLAAIEAVLSAVQTGRPLLV